MWLEKLRTVLNMTFMMHEIQNYDAQLAEIDLEMKQCIRQQGADAPIPLLDHVDSRHVLRHPRSFHMQGRRMCGIAARGRTLLLVGTSLHVALSFGHHTQLATAFCNLVHYPSAPLYGSGLAEQLPPQTLPWQVDFAPMDRLCPDV